MAYLCYKVLLKTTISLTTFRSGTHSLNMIPSLFFGLNSDFWGEKILLELRSIFILQYWLCLALVVIGIYLLEVASETFILEVPLFVTVDFAKAVVKQPLIHLELLGFGVRLYQRLSWCQYFASRCRTVQKCFLISLCRVFTLFRISASDRFGGRRLGDTRLRIMLRGERRHFI